MTIRETAEPNLNSHHAECRRILRRKNCIRCAISSVAPQVFFTEAVGDLLLGNLVEAKRAWRRAERRQLMTCRQLPETAAATVSNQVVLPRPTRVLSRLNRSGVFPPLVPTATIIQESSASRVMEILRWAAASMPPHRLLDALATASGFSWQNSAAILLGSRIIPAPIAPDVIAATRDARDFWQQYSAGRERFSNLVANGVMTNLIGNWASFEHCHLERLLPGIIVPARLRRYDYLTNAIWDAKELSLDVHAGLNAQPLFRHPFPEVFSPLHYGRPHAVLRVKGPELPGISAENRGIGFIRQDSSTNR